MTRLLVLLRSRSLRIGFLLAALAAGVWAVGSQWGEVRLALASIPVSAVFGALALSLVYVVLTMASWRVLLTDLGSRLSLGAASQVFFVSQVGKYIPGGVWNVLAAAEMGADHAIPRRRSVSVMVVSILVSIVTGLALAVLAMVLAPPRVARDFGWVGWFLPLFAVVLAPPMLNRLLGIVLRLTRRPPLERPLTMRGVTLASVWSLLAWVVAGAQVWLLAGALGLELSVGTFALAVGGYALAWTAGFLVVVVPAGVGVREAVLAAVLATHLESGAVVVVVLLSRVLLTAADLALGVTGLGTGRARRRDTGSLTTSS
ncbi:flippase-like domain-containing protein [Georgenia sp. EYE_87]|uniref:lysylphosphatidylglycerol synthase domain-containing protein n=1 Tax=Georgenia sp. EYE_87 TaxID=2853448 RepID=UPI00200538F2|nr:lysylphosphatidylglycerol synthase domain-containing protein [Georgenia sp. EYE_87]MCK6211781.1 flippase-like domain-containing protein [Georgenia sp. EYE_87]